MKSPEEIVKKLLSVPDRHSEQLWNMKTYEFSPSELSEQIRLAVREAVEEAAKICELGLGDMRWRYQSATCHDLAKTIRAHFKDYLT